MASDALWTDVWVAYGAWASVIASTLSTLLIIFGLRYTAKALTAQKKSADVDAMLTIWERLDCHWERLRHTKQEDKEAYQFEFGQLVSYYELACSLFRYNALSTTASIILGEHLRDILPQMEGDATFKDMFDALRSHEDNYEHIRWFLMNGQHLIDQHKLGI